MNAIGKRRPSGALIVAMVALFVALGGTAGAVVTAAVPLAKRALVADTAKNARKLGGQSLGQLTAKTAAAVAAAAQAPGPASTAAGLVSTKTASGQVAAGGAQAFNVACDAGQKVLGGGFSSDQLVLGLDSHPSSDTTWTVLIGNLDDAAAANVTLYATCLK